MFFCVVDEIEILNDSFNPTDYIKKMRKRDEFLAKGWGSPPPRFIRQETEESLGHLIAKNRCGRMLDAKKQMKKYRTQIKQKPKHINEDTCKIPTVYLVARHYISSR